jgi:dihydropteroate synthase
MRPRFDWQLRSRTLALGERTLVMGVVNVTPDSFSDGGDYFHADQAIAHALQLLDQGADILDVGGESTRPGKKEPVTEQEELRRVIPVIAGILREAPNALISVDTYKSAVAEAALRKGAEIVNDVSALSWDPAMATALARHECGVVLMHTRGLPDEWRTQLPHPDIAGTVLQELGAAAGRAMAAGIARDRIMLDPGFGFGKNFDENYPLLARFEELHTLGFPLLSGTSRKSFIGRTLARDGVDLPPKERVVGTMATVAASVLKGAHLVRVHDVRDAVQTVKILDAVLRASG